MPNIRSTLALIAGAIAMTSLAAAVAVPLARSLNPELSTVNAAMLGAAAFIVTIAPILLFRLRTRLRTPKALRRAGAATTLAALMLAGGVMLLGIAAWRGGAAVVNPEAAKRTGAVRQLLIGAGRLLANDIERLTTSAMQRGRKIAADPRVIAALASGDARAMTQACNAAITSSTEIDAVALFDAQGRIVAINTRYADGGTIPQERVDRIMGMSFAGREIINSCVNNGAQSEALEFQTTCDITPAFFDSSGLSVAHSVPVYGPSGAQVGVVSTRVRFERIAALAAAYGVAGGHGTVRFVTDKGGFFDEELNRGAAPPVPPEELAPLTAPLTHSDAEMMTISRQGTFHALFRISGLKTMEGGGIQVMLSVPDSWVGREAMIAAVLDMGTPAAGGVLVLLLAGVLRASVIARDRAELATRVTRQAEAKAREAEEFLRNAMDSLSAHTVVIGSDGRIRSVNRAWAEFAAANGGAGTDAMVGADYLGVCDRSAGKSLEAAEVAAAIRTVLAGDEAPTAIEYPCHAPHERRWFTCSVRGFALNDERFAVVSHLNITAIKLVERELTTANEALAKAHAEVELRVQQRTAQLAVATEAAQAASKAKSEFLATMSHEIRTPLNGVVGTLELLAGSSLSEQQKRYIQIGKTSASSLTSVINDILDFSKIEAGKLELSPVEFDLRGTVGDVMEMLAVRASEKNLEMACSIEPGLPALVRGDPERLRQIIINLVNNAIKFTERGSIALRVAAVSDNAGENTHIRFSVTDTGIGIPKDRLDRLFRAFSQTDASFSRKYGGTGLGLAICKQLAELMGGGVGVESEPGKGSTFWFEAVLPAASMPVAAPPVVAKVECRSLRLLVVDDHEVQRKFIAECLSSLQFPVDTAADGEAALALMLEADAAGHPFAAVLTDHQMPGMDGVEVVVAMQSRPEVASIPVILMSSALDLDPARVQAAGFASHLTKPVRQSTLLDALMAALASKSGVVARVPALEPAAPADPPFSLVPKAAKPRLRVLLAEDNEINRLIACELLGKNGFHCTVASNGVAAVAAVLKDTYDLVLMDCQMPEMDGFEATRQIRQLERSGKLTAQQGRRLTIIALTANALKGDRERCLEAGMDGYSTKPIDLKHLNATIEAMLSQEPHGRQAA